MLSLMLLITVNFKSAHLYKITDLIFSICNMFVCFSGLTSVPNNIPFDTRMVDLQNNKIKEIKENDFKGLTSLYVRIYAHIFKYLLENPYHY